MVMGDRCFLWCILNFWNFISEVIVALCRKKNVLGRELFLGKDSVLVEIEFSLRYL